MSSSVKSLSDVSLEKKPSYSGSVASRKYDSDSSEDEGYLSHDEINTTNNSTTFEQLTKSIESPMPRGTPKPIKVRHADSSPTLISSISSSPKYTIKKMSRTSSAKNTTSEMNPKTEVFDHPDPLFISYDVDNYFLSVQGNTLKKFLNKLQADSNIKLLKDGAIERTNAAINCIENGINYGLGFEMTEDLFMNDPSQLRDKIMSLQYYQRNKNPHNKTSQVFLLISNGSNKQFKGFKSLFSFQTLISTRLGIAARSGDTEEIQELEKISKYLRTLSRFEDMLFFFIHLPKNNYKDWKEQEGNLFPEIMNKVKKAREITPKKSFRRKSKNFLKASGSTIKAFAQNLFDVKNGGIEFTTGIALLGILLFPLIMFYSQSNQ